MIDAVARFQRWAYRTLYARRSYKVEHCDDTPETPAPFVLYLIGETRHPWSAAFICPCGCRETIALSLIADDRPSWRVRQHRNGTVSLLPSVWRIKGCHSHFFLPDSHIVWARATNRLRESLR